MNDLGEIEGSAVARRPDGLFSGAVFGLADQVIDALPIAVYVCDEHGLIVRFNERAAQLWGRTPNLKDPAERFCGSYRLYRLDGGSLPHPECPMAEVLRTGVPVYGQELMMERPDGSRAVALVNIRPLKDARGLLVGAVNCFEDITERRCAERELRAAKAGLEDFFENAVVPMHWVGPDGTILRANEAELDLLGYEHADYVGRNITEFHVDRDVIEDILARLAAGEKIERYPARLRAKDGSLKHVLISSSVNFHDGQFINTRCVTLDVTAARLLEIALREHEARSREILGSLPAAVYTTDAGGRITYYNEAAADLWGCRPELGKSEFCGSWKLYWPDGKPMRHDECPMAIALKTGRAIRGAEAIAERPDGTRIPFIPYPTPLRDSTGKLVGAVNMLVDITDRKKVEDIGQRLAAVVNSSEDSIISTDLNGNVETWNAGAQRLFGYAAEEVIGQPVTVLIPDDHQDKEPQILARIRRGERIDHYETLRRRKDGSLINISLTVSPIKDGEGNIIGASKIARDITERKRAEEFLARHLEELGALYTFTDRLHRADTLSDMYEAALDAILRALRCPRAAILAFDAAGVMKFVASRGLSQTYRDAVEGHSPWRPGEDDPRPICIADIETADIPDSLKETVGTEGIGALGFFPLVAGVKLIGKFMAYYDTPHVFTGGEADLALTITRQLAFGIERVRVQEELRKQQEHERARAAELQAIMEAVPAVIWIARDPDSRVIIGNKTAHEFLRMAPQANLSLSAADPERPTHFQVLSGGRVLAPEELPVQRAARGEDVHNFEEEVRFDDGTSAYLIGNATPLRDAQGNPAGAVAAFVDITGRKKAEQQLDLLVSELNHRVKNTLATVMSIARQSFSNTSNIAEAHRAFESRVRALAQTHSRLAEAHWAGVSLQTMLLDEFAPYRCDDGRNVRLSGPAVDLSPRCILTLGMAVHELVTNAAKHGALSATNGLVEVGWNIDSENGKLVIRWTESGGPPVAPPRRAGFGRLLLERALASDLQGGVQLEFDPQGLRCLMALPLDQCVAPFTDPPHCPVDQLQRH